MKPKISVYVGTSLDGFIARKDGGLDFLDFDSTDSSENGGSDGPELDSTDSSEEDYGFFEFMATVDSLVMGRNTFEILTTFDEWIYGDTPLTVLSTTLGPGDIPKRFEGKVSIASGTPEEIVEAQAGKGMKHIYVDGGITAQAFLNAGLVDELTISKLPVLIGDGIPLFGALDKDIRLEHISTKAFPSGLVQMKYRTR